MAPGPALGAAAPSHQPNANKRIRSAPGVAENPQRGEERRDKDGAAKT